MKGNMREQPEMKVKGERLMICEGYGAAAVWRPVYFVGTQTRFIYRVADLSATRQSTSTRRRFRKPTERELADWPEKMQGKRL